MKRSPGRARKRPLEPLTPGQHAALLQHLAQHPQSLDAEPLKREELAAVLRGESPLTPPTARLLAVAQLRARPQELFACLYLDHRHHLIAFEELFHGTRDCAEVSVSEIQRRVLLYAARALILAHNHPSGVAAPSFADQIITRRLRDLFALEGCSILDHLIVGASRCYSFSEHGLL